MYFILCVNKNITLTRYPLTSPNCQRGPLPPEKCQGPLKKISMSQQLCD